MNKVVKIVLGVVLVLAVAGGSFYGGTVYGKSQLQAQFTAGRAGGFPGQGGFTARTGTQNGQAGGARGNMLFGTIKTVNADGLVVTDQNKNDINVKIAGTTLIEKNMTVKVTDLAEGETVIISGNKADDGTITARSLQVAPAGRFNAQGGPTQSGGAQSSGQGDAPPPPPGD